MELLDAIAQEVVEEKVYITRFALNAISATTRKEGQEFLREILLMIHKGKIEIIDQSISDDLLANSIKNDIGLDFDDATQYIAAGKVQTYLVTFDQDFKKTGLQTKTPSEVLETVLLPSV